MAEAGPSTTREAPEHTLPSSTPFYSVEFPGYVRPESAPQAIRHLGGQDSLNRAFKKNATKIEALVELNWRPENPYSHPIPGDVVVTSNVLVKVRKRKRRVREGDDAQEPEVVGEFTAEAVGVIQRTVRFRNMADYQYTPDLSDPVAQLRSAMDRMDVQAIKNYTIPPELENYSLPLDAASATAAPTPQSFETPAGLIGEPRHRSNLRLFPPPVFSRQNLPQFYNYKANSNSIVTTVVDSETGVEKKRLINRARWKGYGPATMSFADKEVPTEVPPNVLEVENQADKRIRTRLVQLFEERPSWIRQALNNQFNAADVREITNSKILLPLVAYAVQDGPWRDTLNRLGWDPRTDPSARFYQRLFFRNSDHLVLRPSVVTRRQEARVLPSSQSAAQEGGQAPNDDAIPQSHIFDGEHLTKDTAAFQLCDIHDPMLKEMIEDEDAVRDECNERDGWYTTHALENIKTVLRHKFFSLLDGHIATEQECLALLDPESIASVTTRSAELRKRRPRRHNMAKGAQRPEDAAVARLRATLESKARGGKRAE